MADGDMIEAPIISGGEGSELQDKQIDHSLTQGSSARFRNDNLPAKAQKEIIQEGKLKIEEVRDQLQNLEELSDPFTDNQENVIDADKEYSGLVREVQERRSGNQYQLLQEKVLKARQAKDSFVGERRVFNDADRARHQRLLELASKKRFGVFGGLKQKEKFLQMVEYIEANSWYLKLEYEKFDHEPTAEELAALKEKWEPQGYKLNSPYETREEPGHYSVSAETIEHSNLPENTVEVLREIANSSKDPATSLESLSKLGIFNVREIGQSGSYYMSREIKDMIKFLSSPGSDDILRVIGGIGNFKKFYSYSGENDIYATLSRYTKGDIARITPETIEKIDIISAARGSMEVNFENIAQMKALTEDKESFDFVVASCLAQAPLPYDSEEFFNTISTLKRDGLLVPLTELYQSNVYVRRTDALRSRINTHEGSEYKTLQEFVGSDEVREFLGSQDMKDFARVVKNLTGITPTIADLQICFDNKEKIAVLLERTVTEQDKVKWAENSYYNAQYVLGNANAFVEKGNFDIFSAPEFQEYVSDLHEKYGIDLTVNNYLRTFRSMYEDRYEDKCIPVELFKLREVIEIYDKGDIRELVERSLQPDQKSQDEASKILAWYGERNKYIDTIKTFQKYQRLIGEEKVAALLNADPWELQRIQEGGLCTENIFQQIPEDQLVSWIDTCSQVSNNVQAIIARKISERGRLINSDVQKIKDLKNLLYDVNITSNPLTRRWGVGELLAEADGQVNEYFQDSLPTNKFIQEVLDRNRNDLLDVLASEYDIFSFSREYTTILNNWRDFPIQIRATIMESGSDLSQTLSDVPEKYKVLSEVYKYGSVREFNPATITEFNNLGDDVVNLLQDAVPSRQMINLLVKSRDLNVLPSFLSEEVLMKFEGNERKALELFKIFPDLRHVILDISPNFPDISSEDLDFIIQVQKVAGDKSQEVFSEYLNYTKGREATVYDRTLVADFAHRYKDPNTYKEQALRRGYKMMGEHLSFDSYRVMKSILDRSISDEELKNMGLTSMGEEGLVELESIMRSFMFNLTSSEIDLSLLRNKLFSDFFKAHVRYETSAWGNHSEDNFNEIIETERLVIESGITHTDFPSSGMQEITKLERSNDNDFTESFLARYGTLAQNIQKALELSANPRSFSTLADEVKVKRDEFVKILQEDFVKNTENPKAQSHIQARIDRLNAVDPSDLKSFQSNFSVLAQEKTFNDLLMQAVFLYTLKKFPEQSTRMSEALSGFTPDVDSISAVLDFTQHMTTKEAWVSYFTDKNARRAFQNILDVKEIEDGLSRLQGGVKSNLSLIEFIPTRGILLEFSGYVADACWASKYNNTAEAFPNITAVIMQDVSKEIPKLIGSTLLIKSTATDGTPLLIIRGLNPQESYINHVDIPDFFDKFTKYIRNLADREERKVAIVIDGHSGGAATNRPLLHRFLSEKKNELTKVGVLTEDTTFNGYDISNSTYILD